MMCIRLSDWPLDPSALQVFMLSSVWRPRINSEEQATMASQGTAQSDCTRLRTSLDNLLSFGSWWTYSGRACMFMGWFPLLGRRADQGGAMWKGSPTDVVPCRVVAAAGQRTASTTGPPGLEIRALVTRSLDQTISNNGDACGVHMMGTLDDC